MCIQFPQLFQSLQESLLRIIDIGTIKINSWEWSLCHNHGYILGKEAVGRDNLCSILQNIHPMSNMMDIFIWWCAPGGFSVKSSYERLGACGAHNLVYSIKLLSSLKCV